MKHLKFLAIAAIIALSSCSDDEVTDTQKPKSVSDEASIYGTWKVASYKVPSGDMTMSGCTTTGISADYRADIYFVQTEHTFSPDAYSYVNSCKGESGTSFVTYNYDGNAGYTLGGWENNDGFAYHVTSLTSTKMVFHTPTGIDITLVRK